MHLPRLLPKLLTLLFLSACLDLPEIDVAPDTSSSGDAGQHDAGTTDQTDSRPDGGTGADGGEQQEPVVRLVLAGNPSHAHGSVTIQVEISEPQPDRVELFAGEVLIAELSAPYSYSWDTTAIAEGTYSLVARLVKGDITATSGERQLTIDRTAPRVLSRTPAPDEPLVPSGETIRIEFSEGLRPDTLTDGSVILHVNGTHIAKTLALSADGKHLTVVPASPIVLASTASVTLANGIKDWAGNELEATPLSWKWQVPAWLPVGPTTGLPIPGAFSPVLRLHPRTGPVLAALATSGPEDYGPAVCRWTGNSWEQLGGFLGVSRYDPENQDYFRFHGPDLQVDDDGTLVVAWSELNSSSQLTYLRRWDTSRWMEIPSVGAGSTATSLQLTSADNPWTATIISDAQRAGLSVQVRWWNGQAWQDFGAALHASTTSSWIYEVSLALDGAGLPVVAWNEAEQVNGSYTNRRIHVRRWTHAGWAALGGALSIKASGSEASRPVLRLSKTGVPVLAWSEPNTDLTKTKAADIHVLRWEEGQWRQLGDSLSTTAGETPAWKPSLVIDDNGAPFIAWVESDGTANKVHLRRWSGTEWQTLEGTESVIEASTRGGDPSLQLDAAGNPWVAWVTDKYVAHVYRFNR
jgi:hypothetical protein